MEADYTVPVHCEARGIPYVEIELRQDLIGDAQSQQEWARLLADIFPRALEKSDVLAA
jgi:predicted N-formylglutamate amidohydrolase